MERGRTVKSLFAALSLVGLLWGCSNPPTGPTPSPSSTSLSVLADVFP